MSGYSPTITAERNIFMTPAMTRPEKLRAFIDEFFDGKQKRLAEEYEFSQSQVSSWLNPNNDKSEVPVYMDRIIDLKIQVQKLQSQVDEMEAGRVVQMKSSYAVVQFSDSASPGVVLCRGIKDLEAASRMVKALITLRKNERTLDEKDT
jgi:hypothetical protein